MVTDEKLRELLEIIRWPWEGSRVIDNYIEFNGALDALRGLGPALAEALLATRQEIAELKEQLAQEARADIEVNEMVGKLEADLTQARQGESEAMESLRDCAKRLHSCALHSGTTEPFATLAVEKYATLVASYDKEKANG